MCVYVAMDKSDECASVAMNYSRLIGGGELENCI